MKLLKINFRDFLNDFCNFHLTLFYNLQTSLLGEYVLKNNSVDASNKMITLYCVLVKLNE